MSEQENSVLGDVCAADPLQRLSAATAEYQLHVAAGDMAAAVRTLVSRLALVHLAHGKFSAAAVRARLTVARAYLELRGLHAQALQHATAAQQLYHQLRDAADPPLPQAELAALAADTYLAMAQALAAAQRFAEARRCLNKVDRAQHEAADLAWQLSLQRAKGCVLQHTGEMAAAIEHLGVAVDLAKQQAGLAVASGSTSDSQGGPGPSHASSKTAQPASKSGKAEAARRAQEALHRAKQDKRQSEADMLAAAELAQQQIHERHAATILVACFCERGALGRGYFFLWRVWVRGFGA